MRRTISAVLVALLLFTAIPLLTARTAQAADFSNVRVLLSTGSVNTLTIPFSGNYFLQENGAAFTGGTLTVQVVGNQLMVTHSSRGQIYQGSSVTIMREHMDPSAGSFQVTTTSGTRSYLGHLILKYSGGYIRAINVVPLAHYLYGVVPYEMSNTFPLEALKAQAVAAKCYAISGMTGSGDYDIGDTASDQVYKGYNASYTTAINAVDATCNACLYLGGTILRSYFAASNGGATILPSDAWSGTDRYRWDAAYARVSDPYDTANPESQQETVLFPANGDSGGMSPALSNYLRAVAAASLNSTGQLGGGTVMGIQAISGLVIASDTVANITMTVALQLPTGVTAVTVQAGFYLSDLVNYGVMTNPQSLRLYTVTQAANGFQLSRGRYGHGVGLSQRGAQQMAKTGWSYTQILQFYYPGASLQQVAFAPPTDPVKPVDTTQATSSSPIATAVTTANVNIREKASASSKLLGSLPKGISLNVYAQENGFSLTQINGVSGYVSNSYLSITPASTGTGTTGTGGGTSANPIIAYGTVNSSTLNLRSGASTSSPVLAILTKSTAVGIYGITQDGQWYYGTANGMTGYLSAQYVALGSASSGSTAPTTTASIPTGSAAVTIVEGAPLRATPSVTGSILAGLAKGAAVTVLGEANGFYAVQFGGLQGYVAKEHLGASAGSAGGTTTGGTTGTTTGSTTGTTGSDVTGGAGVTTGSVALRQGPGTNYTKLTTLSKGAKLTLYSLSGDWYKVNANGTDGYVSKTYVKVTTAIPQTWTGVVVNEWVRMRSTPDLNTQNNIVANYAVGTQVTILAQTTNSFYKVVVNGVTGYMSTDFVQVTSGSAAGAAGTGSSAASSSQTGVTTANVYMRASASSSGKVLVTLSKGTKVTILGASGSYYKVQAGSKTGYVVQKYVKAN